MSAPDIINQLTLRLGIGNVNTGTQYVVDIMAGTHHIAPALRQREQRAAMQRGSEGSARAVEILAAVGLGSYEILEDKHLSI
jgi:hypothetical protein